jgi:hypothetical protein
MTYLNIGRWLLLIPTVVGAWYLTGFAWAVFVDIPIRRAFCPIDDTAACPSPGYDTYKHIVLYSFAVISPLVVELVSTLVAPSHKKMALWLTFSFGAVAAAYLGYSALTAPTIENFAYTVPPVVDPRFDRVYAAGVAIAMGFVYALVISAVLKR